MSAPAGARLRGYDEGEEPDPNRWRALIVCLVGGFMTLLDVSIVNVALPSIRAGLGTSEGATQWILSGYALTFGLLLVPAGRLGDVRGRRTMFVAGLTLFTLASVLCGAAPNSLTLVLARLLQGLAGGLLTPQISALIQQLFRGSERAKAFGIFGATVGLSTAIGPLLGGVLIQIFGDTSGWRWVFFVNLPIGIVAVPLALKLLPGPDPNQKRKKHDYDPVGVVLLGAAVVVLLLPFVQEQQWKGQAKWLLVPAALVLLGLFLLWERVYGRRHEPLVDLSLFTESSYSYGTAMISVYFAGFTAIFFVFTFYLQNGLGYSALLSGLSTVPFAFGGAVGAPVGGRLIERLGRPMIAGGLVLVALGLGAAILLVRAADGSNVGWFTALPLLIAGFGGGLVISPNATLTLSQVPVARAGTAGGLLQTGQRIGSAAGIAAVGSVFFAHLASAGGSGGGSGSGSGAASSTSGSGGALPKAIQDVFAGAFERGVTVAVGFVVVALLVALAEIVLGRRARRGQPESEVAVPQHAAVGTAVDGEHYHPAHERSATDPPATDQPATDQSATGQPAAERIADQQPATGAERA